MPFYTLKCKECNYRVEKIVHTTKGVEDKHYCPKCFMKLKSVLLKRDFNPPKNLVIKGSDKHRDIHTDDKKVKSEFEQQWNDVLDDNQAELDKEKENDENI
tara:strand:+ start:745 stop:1047 length:303 start_codon:yes stop_codon:yes gene_type:complete